MEASEDVTNNTYLTKKAKYLLTAGCYLSFFAYGLSNTLVVSTLLDIKDNLNSSFKDASFGFVIGAIIHGICFLFFGKLVNYVDKRHVLWIVMLIAGFSIFVIPYIKSLTIFYTTFSLFTSMTAGLSIISQSWILNLWQEQANQYMQGFHFSYSVGMTIAPIVSAPYLSNKSIEESDSANVTSPYAFSLLHFRSFIGNGLDLNHWPSLFVPYTLGSSFLFASTIVFILMILYENYLKTNRQPYRQFNDVVVVNKQLASTKNKIVPRKSNSWLAILIATAICFCYQFAEYNSITFITEFIYYLTGDKKTGSYVATIFSGTYALSRFAGIFVAKYIAVKHMLFGHITIALILNIPILIFASSTVTVLSILFILLGMGYSCVFAALYSFFNLTFNMTSQIFSFFLMSAASACIVVPLLEGLFLEKYPPTYVYLNLTSLLLCLLLLSLLVYITGKNNNNNNNTNQPNTDSSSIEQNNNHQIQP